MNKLCCLVVSTICVCAPLAPAGVVLQYDFNTPNDKAGWTATSVSAGAFIFQNVDGLFWTASGAQGAGGLLFIEQPTWNWSELFTAPDELVQAVRTTPHPHLSYDLTSDGDGGTHRIFLRGLADAYIHTSLGPEVIGYGTFKHWQINLRDPDVTWQYGVGNLPVPHQEVMTILDNLTGLYITADPGDTRANFRSNSAILDNVVLTNIPAPPTLTFLAFAALTLCGRTRR